MSEQTAKLTDPFPDEEIKFFVTATNQEKTQGKVAAYADARAYMEQLDRVLGPMNWSTEYIIHDQANKAVECRLSVRTEDGWVTKANIGYPNEAQDADNAAKEPLKAAYSDALKRAAVEWGVGRFLYSLKLARDWLPIKQHGRSYVFTEQPHVMREGEKAPPPKAEPQKVEVKKPTFWETMTNNGFSQSEVSERSLTMFGREPDDLTPKEKNDLYIDMTKAKLAPKETASA